MLGWDYRRKVSSTAVLVVLWLFFPWHVLIVKPESISFEIGSHSRQADVAWEWQLGDTNWWMCSYPIQWQGVGVLRKLRRHPFSPWILLNIAIYCNIGLVQHRQEIDIKNRINKGRAITVMLNNVLWNRQITRKNRLLIYNSIVKSRLLSHMELKHGNLTTF